MGKAEFTKTSLHNHFGGNKADYLRNRNNSDATFDLNLAKIKIDEAASQNYQLLGMTNHNSFWKDEYEQLVEYIKNKKYDICLIPGAEIHIYNKFNGTTKYLHVVMLISPNSDLDIFVNKLNSYKSANGFEAIDIEQLTELAFLNKCILIPHGLKQRDRSASENVAVFDDLLALKYFLPILIEDNSKSHKKILEMKIKSHLSNENFEWLENAGSISALDQQTSFSDIKEPTYIWGEPSFDSLFYCAIIGEERVLRENDIIEKNKYIKRIEIKNKSGVLQDADLHMSHGLNSIIGKSGSGKTLLLNLINKKLTGNNLKNAISVSNADYDKMYQGSEVYLYDNNDNVLKKGDVNIFEGENLYKQVVAALNFNSNELLDNLKAKPSFDYTQGLINKFNKDLNQYIADKISINNYKKQIDDSIIKVNASLDYLSSNKGLPNQVEYIFDPSLKTEKEKLLKEEEEIIKDIEIIKNSFDIIIKMLEKYNLEDEKDGLKVLKLKLLKKASLEKNINNEKLINKEIEILCAEKISSIVLEYNKTIGERARGVTEARQSILDEFENIVNFLKTIVSIKQSLYIPTLCEEEIRNSMKQVGGEDDYVRLQILEINGDVKYDDFEDYFEGVIGKALAKINKSEFSEFKNKPLSLFEQDSIKKFAEIFIKNRRTNPNILKLIEDKLVKFEIMIKNLDGKYEKIDSLSAGQLSKIYINLLIDRDLKGMENSAIILYDQPDNNLEKEFILNALGKKLCELKRKYQVIITTHEPLLVINSDSNNIIHAVNDPKAGKSSITFENLTMYDVGDKKEAVDKIAQIIDGSKGAISIRNQIYGGSKL